MNFIELQRFVIPFEELEKTANNEECEKCRKTAEQIGLTPTEMGCEEECIETIYKMEDLNLQPQLINVKDILKATPTVDNKLILYLKSDKGLDEDNVITHIPNFFDITYDEFLKKLENNGVKIWK